ncbi:uncharacterized protein TNCV_4606301 [Trichonephila clavipes]|nr:uncharacterized protein TNCV_4606301 [Trichonephila clavipes]
MQIRVEGYLIRGITQCFKCNNFYHTAADSHLKPRCPKCGEEHLTNDCKIKERQENPFCINCQVYRPTACYSKCPKFPKPKKGTPIFHNNAKKFDSKNTIEEFSFADALRGNSPTNINIPDVINDSKEGQSQSQIIPHNDRNANDIQNL